MSHTFRQSVVEGRMSLPVTAVATALLWSLGPREEVALWLAMAVVALSAYVIVEWNVQCQLLRIRSRMNSVTFLTLLAALPALHDQPLQLLPALGLLGALFALFKGYGLYRPQGYAFHCFLFVSAASLIFPPLLLLVPTLLFSMLFHLRMQSMPTLTASLLGLVAPYWIFVPMDFLLDPERVLLVRWFAFFDPLLPGYTLVAPWQWGTVAMLLPLGLTAVVHYLRTSYADKIRTRQNYSVLLLQLVSLCLIAAWRPADAAMTLPLLIVVLTPFVAHYLALARSHSMRWWFALWMLVVVALGVMNYLNLWDVLTSAPLDLSAWNSFIS